MIVRRLLGWLMLSSMALAPLTLALPAVGQVPLMTPPPQLRPGVAPMPFKGDGSGSLQVLAPDGKRLECPLKHTSVHAVVSGYVARVTVKQLFGNPFKNKIEALYTFPLSDSGAVDEMYMRVAGRTIHGTIKKREEAREIYERAKMAGHVAALLDQERPNIFTQSVANIEPGKDVEVTLSYVDLLPYRDGAYSFAFPTVVGPRFNPGAPSGRSGMGFSTDTTTVPDASKITPHVSPEGVRAGHDLSIDVSIDAGVPIGAIDSQLHAVTVHRAGEAKATVNLTDKETIPNKDFVLTWGVSADKLRSGCLTNGAGGSGYFTLMLLPPKKPTSDQIQPKEMIFLIDCSGSQSGAPLQKAKEAMEYSLDHMNARDTFQVVAFNNSVARLFDHPRQANQMMRQAAKRFVEDLQARGGTWMAPAVEAVCAEPNDDHRLRVVSFMTDGFVGNDFQIIGLIKKLREKSRWFPFGTGNSVNRFLIDNIARAGGGEADYVYLNSNAAEVGKKFYDKIASPVLTDVKVDFGGLEVKEVFPREIADVWDRHPLYITGRYLKAGSGKVTVTGFSGGKPYRETLNVTLPAENKDNQVLGSVWARAKVDRLMDEDWLGAQSGSVNKELKDEIVKVALEHHIMTQYTSFVAVEEKIVTKGGASQTIEVPVELPEGVSREGVFGDNKGENGRVIQAYAGGGAYQPAKQAYASKVGSGYGYGSGSGGGGGGPARGIIIGGSAGPMAMSKSLHMNGYNFAPGSASVRPSVAMLPQAPPSTAIPMPRSIAMQKSVHANFVDGTSEARTPIRALSAADRAAAMAKLSARLQKLYDGDGLRHEDGLIKDGRIHIRISVADASEQGLYQIRRLGFQIEATIYADGKVEGWIGAEELLDVAADKNTLAVESLSGA